MTLLVIISLYAGLISPLTAALSELVTSLSEAGQLALSSSSLVVPAWVIRLIVAMPCVYRGHKKQILHPAIVSGCPSLRWHTQDAKYRVLLPLWRKQATARRVRPPTAPRVTMPKGHATGAGTRTNKRSKNAWRSHGPRDTESLRLLTARPIVGCRPTLALPLRSHETPARDASRWDIPVVTLHSRADHDGFRGSWLLLQ